MIPTGEIATRARTSLASGRRVFRMADTLLALLLSSVVVACSTVGGTSEAGPVVPTDPPIRMAAGGPTEDETSDRLIAEARSALDTAAYEEAERLAREVIRAHAAAEGSSAALRVLARALYQQERFGEVEPVVERYAALLPAADDRVVQMKILAGRAALGESRDFDAVAHWLSVPADAREELREAAGERLRSRLGQLSISELRALGERFPESPHLGPLLAELALEEYLAGDREAATTTAARALERGASGRAQRMAQGVLDGDVSEFVFQPRLGVVLPSTGSPHLRDLAEEVSEGVQVALAKFGGGMQTRMAVELLERDNRGTGGSGAEIVAELERNGALGVIGPLQEGLLEEFAAARSGALPMISPTATTVPEGVPDVYSLQGAAEESARAVAAYARDREIETAVLIYPEIPEARREAAAFRDAYGAGGGTILAELTYAEGTTYFAEQMQSAAGLEPEVVVFPIPAADVELVAPQVTYFGLDSQGIQVLGTSGWTDPEILARVDDRHTNGVVAATPQPSGEEWTGAENFRDAYERMFQNTLRSSVPQYGYDAALILLEAVQSGARTSEEVAAALRNLENVRGATGEFSVRDGQLNRRNYVVCLQDGVSRVMPEGERPRWTLFPPLRDPETDSIPPGVPPRIVGFRCPGAPVPPGALDDSIYHPDSAFIDPDTLPVDSTEVDSTMAVDTFFVPSR